ncbi:hypothetical protein FHT00_002440 [Sphingomonas insulae]|uniref:4-amino-4-deoxy-L-arabinose transferase n=1 Tax=Sphingomonas insulae TaxID=424800 RepID=A0ABN1HK72_9SPHN|nr:hypothetical protein [Sphingomonas insulae]NIJ30477.1 hypothetical protein [Sphingomonas insulae]
MSARLRHDALLACALAVLMTLAWGWSDWAHLSALRLPDTDDVVRLQQIRDWLGGQRWGDLTQHRLGPPPGLPMHWSRLADLGPAAIIAALTPWTGSARAELVAILVWPGMLFAVALFLIARIARRVGGGDIVPAATVVAAIAYPATTIFLPGRIDHHNLQVVLLLAAVVAVLHGGTRAAVLAGVCVGASLIVGLETLPILAALGAVMLWHWTGRGTAPLAAFGLGTIAALLAGRIAFAGDGFAFPACDGFTTPAFTAALVLASALPVVSILARRATDRPGRMLVAAATIVPAACIALMRAPQCLSPYGAVDPRLATLWLSHVEEAQSVFAASPATIVGYIGLAVVGLIATAWQAWRHRSAGWTMLALLLAVATAIAAVQLRGAYAAAILSAPGLAAAIAAARTRGGGWLIAAWLVSAGMLYPLAAAAFATRPAPAVRTTAHGDCGSAAAMRTLARLPRGIVMAPVDAGAWALAATSHRVLAAPYHRNAVGNLAAYRFYAATPERAARIAAALHVDYVMACANLPGADDPDSAAAALVAGGSVPGFVHRADATDGTMIFARQRLSGAAPTP